jgi:hypothetical protein
LKVTVTPGFAASNFFPISVKASVSEAAANTFRVFWVAIALGLGSVGRVVGALVASGVEIVEGVRAGEHPARNNARVAINNSERFIS